MESQKQPYPEPAPLVSAEHQKAIERSQSTHFRIEKELGEGGMSVVYKCIDLAVQRPVAIKFLKARLAGEEKWLMRFQQEAKAIGRLSHPNIVRIHHFDLESGEPFIVMDYVEGTPLADILAKEGTLEPARAIAIMSQVMDALAHAHQHDVVHRDLKPSNIMIVNANTAAETVKILDFGIAKILGEEPNYKLTQTGEIFGSPLYMSPEQCKGESADGRSDQYACGAVLFECLTGHPPFTGEHAVGIITKHVYDAPPTLKEASLGRHFVPRLDKVVHKLLAKEPEQRFESMVAAKLAVESALAPEEKLVTPESSNNSKRKFLQWTLVIATTIGISGGLFIWIKWALTPEPITLQTRYDKMSVDDVLNADFGDQAVSDYLDNKAYNHQSDIEFDANALGFKVMTDASLEKVAKMPNLQKADFSYQRSLTMKGLRALTMTPNLQDLSLRGTYLGNDSVPVLAQMKALRRLDMSETPLDKDGIEQISHLKLETLTLRDIPALTNDSCESLPKLQSLQSLNISSNPLLDSGLIKVCKLKNLTYLDLREDGIRDQDLKDLPNLTELRVLHLGSTKVTDDGMAALVKLKTVDKLYLNSSGITEKGLQKLTAMKGLRYLNLHNTKIPVKAIKHFLKQKRSCQVSMREPGAHENEMMAP